MANIYIYIYIYYIYIYLENHKDKIFCPYGFGHFFCPLRFFFSNTAMSGCKPSTYRLIVFLNSWICRTGSDSISVSSRDSIWGSMLTFATFFSTWCWKNTGILWVHPNLVGNMAVFVARLSRLPVCSTLDWNSSFGNCGRMSEHGVDKGFEQPFTIKNQNTQLNKRNVRYG